MLFWFVVAPHFTETKKEFKGSEKSSSGTEVKCILTRAAHAESGGTGSRAGSVPGLALGLGVAHALVVGGRVASLVGEAHHLEDVQDWNSGGTTHEDT